MPAAVVFALEMPSGAGAAILALVGIIIVMFISLAIWASRYVKVPPNQVLIVSGRARRFVAQDGTVRTLGFRMVRGGGGTVVLPVIERADVLSMEVLTIDLQLKEVYASKGAVQVSATAQIKINNDDNSIAQAARHFLGKGSDAMKEVARPILERHLCAVLSTISADEIQRSRALLGPKIQQSATAGLAALGLGIVDLTIRDVRERAG